MFLAKRQLLAHGHGHVIRCVSKSGELLERERRFRRGAWQAAELLERTFVGCLGPNLQFLAHGHGRAIRYVCKSGERLERERRLRPDAWHASKLLESTFVGRLGPNINFSHMRWAPVPTGGREAVDEQRAALLQKWRTS